LSKIHNLIPGLVLLSLSVLFGCETDSFIDPSRTGYFETTPTAMPILTRIDVVEPVDPGTDFVKVDPDMLKPSPATYTFSAGDVLQISIPSLMQTGQTEVADRIIDQSGDIQLPVINKIRAAGLTTEELQVLIESRLKGVITNPQAFVALKEGRTFQYRVLGSVDQPGIFALTKPDFRLLDALATARGASVNTSRILITRVSESPDEHKAEYDRKPSTKTGDSAQNTQQTNASQSSTSTPQTSAPAAAPSPTIAAPSSFDIDQLINELPSTTTPTTPAVAPTAEPAAASTTEPAAAPTAEPLAAPTTEPAAPPTTEPTAVPTAEPAAEPAAEPTAVPTMEPAGAPTAEPAAVPTTEPAAAPTMEPGADPKNIPSKKQTQLGMLRAANRQDPPVDIDALEPAKADDRASANLNSTTTSNSSDGNGGDQFIFDNASQSWVRKSAMTASANNQASTPDSNSTSIVDSAGSGSTTDSGNNAGLRSVENATNKKKLNDDKLEKTVVIEIEYNKLVRGDSSLNIVIKPGDAIYCDSGDVGVVYIDGEISRPGVYNLPTAGRLTLSRLVAAAGGVSELAIPERCDLIRRLDSDKEACVRISLLAIRNRGEPDLFLKRDDHIIVGTNFWALPLSRVRRDLSFPNSIGFQLDRNFGNDVFGAPPTGITTN
jgi:protein involved in polysaccharide export with SLBB domain